MSSFERERGRYRITTDPSRVDVDAVHAYLTRSYWAEGIPRETVELSIAGSLCFSLLDGERQVGFARLVTDKATFAYLCDVYVLESHRGQGLGKWLVETVMAYPGLAWLRRILLVTRDAHGLYTPFGFEPLNGPGACLQIVRRGIYAARGGEVAPR